MTTEWLHTVEDLLLGGAECVAQLNALSDEAAAHSPSASACASTARAAAALWDGRMEEVLNSDFARSIVAPLLAIKSKEELQSLDVSAVLGAQVRAHLSSASAQADPLLAQMQVLLLAVAALQDFVANNYTGPPSARSALFAAWDSTLSDFAGEWASQRLRMDGEDVYEHSYHPVSLVIAKCIFLQPDLVSLLPGLHSLSWWSMRYARAHQDLLEQNSATLKKHIDVIIPRAMAEYCTVVPEAALVNAAANEPASASSSAASSSAAPAAAPVAAAAASSPLRRRLCTHLYLEACHIYHGYWQYKAIEECLAAAQSSLGVEVELTGLMGKRTRWQREEKAQLLVRVIPSEKKIAEMEAQKATLAAPVDPLLIELLPYGLSLDSDVLLNSIALSAHEQTYLDGPLSVSEQALLLAIFERTHRVTSQHITRDEEMLCYITRVMEEARSGRTQNRSWAIECSALYHRSVLECSDKHSQDRALQQLEELSALFDRLHAATTVSSVAELAHAKTMEEYRREDVIRIRMRDVYLSNYPSIWTLKQGIAATFQKIGLFKSALDLFESISAYDGIIESCMLLGKITQAETLIRDRLKEKPADPKLLCLLADCTRDISFYEQAWEVSAHTYPRAQRSLANFKMGRGLHAEAIPHFQRALDINPVFPAEWYAMGFCAIQTRQFELATSAFSRTVSFDPEYANAWNNLAAAHLHLRNKPQAFSALEQAIKFQNESWKLWENYMLTAVDLHEYSKAMTAMDRIVELKKDLNTQGEKEARLEKEEKTGEAGSRVLDEQVLVILCKVSIDAAREHGPTTFLLQRFIQLLHKVSESLPTNAVVYGCLASALDARGEPDKSLVFREKEVRFLQSGAWTDSIVRVQDVVRAHSDLTDAYIRSNTKSHLLAAKFTLDALLGKLRKAAAVTESKEGKECISQVEDMSKRVAAAMPTAQANLTAAGAGAGSGPAAGGAGSGAGLPSGAASSINIWR